MSIPSAPSSPPLRSSRDTAFIALGAGVIVATYLYLIVRQPAQLAAGGLGTASLTAVLGYLAGAGLIATGAIHRLPTSTLTLLPVAIVINIASGQLAAAVGLPIYLDSIGTILVGVLAGPAAGAVTGALTNVIWGMTINPIALPFAVTAVVIGVCAGYAARLGIFRRGWLAPGAGLVTGIIAAIISAPIAAFVFGGAAGGGTGALVAALQAMGNGLLAATTLQGLISDPLDKAVTFLIVAVILKALPLRLRSRFPFVRAFNVLGATQAATPRSRHQAPTDAGDA